MRDRQLGEIRRVPGPVQRAVRDRIRPGQELTTPARSARFIVERVDEDGIVLLLGKQRAWTRLSWECLEGIVPYLSGRGWVTIGSLYETRAVEGTLDAYLKNFMKRATAGWVAALLERSGVVEVARTRPAQVRVAREFGSRAI